jgi:type IV pilus assembly protein PilM
MFSLFKSTHSRSVALGIDIGTTNIKVAELTESAAGTYALSNYAILETSGHLEHFNNALQSSSLRPLDSDLISYLTLLKQNNSFKTDRAVASLPPFAALTTLIEIPMMSPGDTNKSLSVQVKDYLPVPINEVTLDWIKIGEKTYPDGTKKQQVFLVSIPNEKIENYARIFGQAGFILDGFEVEHVSLARALTRGVAAPTLIIDIGGRSTSFTVAKGGVALFAGQTDFSSNSLTQALATALNISPRRADVLKQQTVIVGGGGGHELSTILVPIIDVILSEANRALTGFQNTFHEKITSVLVAGGGASMPGLDTYLAKQLALPVTVANALTKVGYPPEIGPFSKELGSSLSVAIGLALKKLIR